MMDKIRTLASIEICLGDYSRIVAKQTHDGIYDIDFNDRDFRIAFHYEWGTHYVFLTELKELWDKHRQEAP